MSKLFFEREMILIYRLTADKFSTISQFPILCFLNMKDCDISKLADFRRINDFGIKQIYLLVEKSIDRYAQIINYDGKCYDI